MRRKDERRRDLSLAWHMAVFAVARVNGKLPDLQTVLDGSHGQSVEQQRSMLRVLSELYKRPMMRDGKEVIH